MKTAQHASLPNLEMFQPRPGRTEPLYATQPEPPKLVLQPLDSPGEFMKIDKRELYVDHDYQRDFISRKRVLRMATHWKWVKCAALSVAIRDDKWWVMDGQHRKLAADMRPDITDLPCMVFDLNSKAKEAGAFVDLNSCKTTVSGVDRFKAMCTAKDPTAIALRNIIESGGRKVRNFNGASTVSCIITLWKLYRRNPNALAAIWPVIVEIHPGSGIYDSTVRGIFGAEVKARSVGLSLAEHPLRGVMARITGPAIRAEIRRQVQITGRGGERLETASVVLLVNRERGAARHKLPE